MQGPLSGPVAFPYALRPGQAELIAAIRATQRKRDHLVLEAGTGTGKTVCALAASHETTRQDHGRIVYLTRTNSQQSQVLREHAALKDVDGTNGYLIPMMGRKQYCPLFRDDPKTSGGTPEELSRMCRDAKKRATDGHHIGRRLEGACPYYQRMLEDGVEPVEALLEAGCKDASTLAHNVEAAGSCPYEALKALLPRARGVILPYIFLLDDRLRDALWSWMGTDAGACHLIVDEAHNLPDAARRHHSPTLTVTTIQRALKEAEAQRDPALDGAVLATTLLHHLLASMHELATEFVHNSEDGLIPPDALQEALMVRLGLPSPAMRRLAAALEDWGEIIREEKRAKGRLPRSYMGAVGTFLTFWFHALDHDFVPLITGGERPAVEAFLLDPASRLGWLQELASTTHMSGTMAPLKDHLVACGLPTSTPCRTFETPFDPTRLRTVGIQGLHRRWAAHQEDPRHAQRQQDACHTFLRRLDGKTALWFPSHRMLAEWQEEGFLHGDSRPRYVETPDMSTPDLVRLVERFKADRDAGSLLLGVLGGRLTEGIDFPGDALQNLIILGIPYPRPTARLQALVHHYDRTHGTGWRTVIHHPVGRVLRQAVGRLIRGPEDHGTAVFLDERVARFHDHLSRLRMLEDAASPLENGPDAEGFLPGNSFKKTPEDIESEMGI